MENEEQRSLQSIPHVPGVYIFKNAQGEVIYIGKAKDLRKRVASYFNKTTTDWKVAQLIEEHETIGHIATHSEIEALLLEASLIKKYQPKYNVLLKDGNPFIFIHLTAPSAVSSRGATGRTGRNGTEIVRSELPQLELINNDKKPGRYIGPFIHRSDARTLFNYVMRTFRLFVCGKSIPNGCLDYHLGRCSGSCRPDFDKDAYLTRLELAFDMLAGNRDLFIEKIRAKIAEHNAQMEFEKSKELSDLLIAIEPLFAALERPFSEHRFAKEVQSIVLPKTLQESDYEAAAQELQELLHLERPPATLDCFDISHFQSSALVGSCVRFTNGKPDPNFFRRFKIKTLTRQNDYAALQEIVGRRYKHGDFPDIIVIDGGKGQRNAVLSIVGPVTCVSLAKREERLFTEFAPEGIKLDYATPLGRLLIALRDYAHHFAITYHRSKRNIGQ